MASSSCVSSDDRLITRDSIFQGGPAITDTSEAVLATADLNSRHAYPVTQDELAKSDLASCKTYYSGQNNVTNTIVFTFWYLDHLGISSVFETSILQTNLERRNYDLLNTTTFESNSDYYRFTTKV
ncbi:glycoside hydrolase, family 79 [Artemisia annua]|uniref:Glycoside hydrolase, family 79 n=1 Tax=Artemisia annua TaxID=35608 RepID=A0A2U1NGH1_ARTAN|nr:glycoside hydrolase, family 79 [Artemisia annua]